MKAILVQQGVDKALDDPNTFLTKLKAKPNEILDTNGITYSSIILYLPDNILRQVEDLENARLMDCLQCLVSEDFTK